MPLSLYAEKEDSYGRVIETSEHRKSGGGTVKPSRNYDCRSVDRFGQQEAWLRIKAIDDSACINRLQGLEGAIQGIKKNDLPEKTKEDLKEFYREHK